jgi:arsenate reductase
MNDNQLIIYHNPNCSKSRETLQILNDKNSQPKIIEYLNEPPTAQELRQIITMLGIAPRELLRTGEQIYIDAKLADNSLDDEQIIQAICQYPVLLQRPIVISGNKAVIGRPPAKVLDIID